MAGVELQYTIDFEPAISMLAQLEHFDGYPMFDEIGAYLDSETARRFREGEDWLGAPLIPSLRALAEGGTTLVDRGHLRDSYTHAAYRDSVEHGSNMVYAAIHQLGGVAGRNRAVELVARPILGINEDDMTEVNEIVMAHLRRAMA